MTFLKEKNRAKKIFDILWEKYPDAEPALEYNDPFELLISTILSAQCTDARVNIVTSKLFKKYKKPDDYLKISNKQLEKEIFSTGYYKQKAKRIKESCKILIEKYHGKVPNDFEALTDLPGVGRKTASVIVGNAFGIPSIAVDTHVKRLSNLLGFIESDDTAKIEFKLKELIPMDYWIVSGHLLMNHGRETCIARRPKCEMCIIGKYCPSQKHN
ncbi:MAG: endonuclease III [Ignavibacteria bacterium]|nr:endonuclease III [Ignavibacteria bacterium]